MAAKVFEVGDVLPATTQLKIGWNSDFILTDYDDYPSVTIKSNDDKVYIDAGDSFDVGMPAFRINGQLIAEYFFWQSPYTAYGGGHDYHIIDTSSFTTSQRTIITVGITGLYWQDLNAPSGYSITFEENGGSTVTDLTDQTALPNPLPTPTKSGYTFNGWYYESNFITQAQASDTLSGNVTLYAKWTLNTYTITYNTNGGSAVSTLTEQTTLPSPLPTTTKANHVFAGWYYDSSFTQKAVAGATIESNVTLYAKWYTPTTWCEDIADAIREKEGSSGSIKHVDFAGRIRGLDTCIYLTQEEYDDITTPNENITYIIVEVE